MTEAALKIVQKHERLKGDRINWDSHWDDLAQYILPRKDDVYVRNRTPGEKKTNTLFDSTGIHVNELLASALHSGLTNPATEFFELTTGDPDLDNDDEARKFLQITARKMHRVLNDSNFHQEIHEVYLDLGCFGTGFLIMEEDDDFMVRFHSRPIYEAYIDENSKGQIDFVSRCFRWTVRQIEQEFGEDSLNDNLKKHLMDAPDKKFEVIHQVGPWDGEKNPSGFSFFSRYVVTKEELVVSDSGFNEFPFAIPRWTKISGEKYGRSPGMKALPDVKMLNQMQKVTIRSAQKTVDPPLIMPDDGVLLPLRTAPNSINFRRAGTTDPIESLITGARVDFGIQMIDFVKKNIERSFFIDQLQLREGPQMTATEVAQRAEEQARLLSPALSRQNFELLRPIVDRLFGILLRREELPEIPEVLAGS